MEGYVEPKLYGEADYFEEQCEKAAKALAEADVLLLVTGAGFSADSGLAVYADVARIPAYQSRNLTYSDICQPRWLYSDAALFYGFWGQCFNDYRKTKPHNGFEILCKWRKDQMERSENSGISKQIQSRSQERRGRYFSPWNNYMYAQFGFDEPDFVPYEVPEGTHAGAFKIYTSNVDAHLFDFFEAHEIYECHGNIELWQYGNPFGCDSGIWRAPMDYEFKVNLETMMVPRHDHDKEESDVGTESEDGSDSSGSEEEEETVRTSAEEGQPQNVLEDEEVARIGHTIGSRETRSSTGKLLRFLPPATDQKGWYRGDSVHGDESDENSQAESEKKKSEPGNWPRCGHCYSLARPSILMFGDFSWKFDEAQEARWDVWKRSVLDLCSGVNEDGTSNPWKVCVLEIGCGRRVPTCRNNAEAMVEQVWSRGGSPTLIRINPDFPDAPDDSIASRVCIPIASKGLAALEKIDKFYSNIVGTKGGETKSAADNELTKDAFDSVNEGDSVLEENTAQNETQAECTTSVSNLPARAPLKNQFGEASLLTRNQGLTVSSMAPSVDYS